MSPSSKASVIRSIPLVGGKTTLRYLFFEGVSYLPSFASARDPGVFDHATSTQLKAVEAK